MRFKRFANGAFDNMSIRMKLWVVVAVLALPIVALMAMQFASLQGHADKASGARAGVEFETKALELVRNLQLHRDHEMRVLRGNAASRASLDQTAAAIETNFDELRSLARGADVGNELTRLESEWNAFKGGARSTARESFAAHTAFINERAVHLLLTAAARTELFTDGELASRSVIGALFATVSMTEQIAQSRALGNLAMLDQAGLAPTEAERAAMSAYLTSAGVYADEMRFQLNLAMGADQELARQLTPLIERQEQALATFHAFVNEHYVSAETFDSARAESFYLLGTSAVNASNELVTVAGEAMNEEFDARSSAATRDMQVVGGVALLGIVVALFLALVVSRSITRPVTHLAEVADRISLGELEVEIDVHGTNEVGQLAESLRRMQASLRSAIERLRQRRAA